VTRTLDGSCKTTSVLSRIERLRQSQEAWRNFRWTKESFGPVLQESCAHISGSVLAQMNGDCTLVCSLLPSTNRNIPYKDWRHEYFPFEVIEYAVDQGQDLLVLVEET
jgi:hypothetical protein